MNKWLQFKARHQDSRHETRWHIGDLVTPCHSISDRYHHTSQNTIFCHTLFAEEFESWLIRSLLVYNFRTHLMKQTSYLHKFYLDRYSFHSETYFLKNKAVLLKRSLFFSWKNYSGRIIQSKCPIALVLCVCVDKYYISHFHRILWSQKLIEKSCSCKWYEQWKKCLNIRWVKEMTG